jgi:hypothetical protein
LLDFICFASYISNSSLTNEADESVWALAFHDREIEFLASLLLFAMLTNMVVELWTVRHGVTMKPPPPNEVEYDSSEALRCQSSHLIVFASNLFGVFSEWILRRLKG